MARAVIVTEDEWEHGMKAASVDVGHDWITCGGPDGLRQSGRTGPIARRMEGGRAEVGNGRQGIHGKRQDARFFHLSRAFRPRFRRAAEDYAGKPEVIPILIWLVNSSEPQGADDEATRGARWAIERLTQWIMQPIPS